MLSIRQKSCSKLEKPRRSWLGLSFLFCGLLFSAFCFLKAMPGSSLRAESSRTTAQRNSIARSTPDLGYRTKNIEDICVADWVLTADPNDIRPEGTIVREAALSKLVLVVERRRDDGRVRDINAQAIQQPKWKQAKEGSVVNSLFQVVRYTYAEPTGEADVSWLMPAGSIVALADGSLCALRTLRPGDRIRLAQDVIGTVRHVIAPFIPRAPPQEKTGAAATVCRRVIGTVKHTSDTVVDLRYGDETVTATPNHPFWEARRRDWVPAGELREGDLLLAASGSLVPLELTHMRTGRFEVYNLEVEGSHTYFAGSNCVLVHNSGGINPCAMSPIPAGPSTMAAGGLGNIGGGAATPDGIFRSALAWLGREYEEIDPGVYRSNEFPSRQFRMTDDDLTDPIQGPHVHFESIGPDGREIVENSHVSVQAAPP